MMGARDCIIPAFENERASESEDGNSILSAYFNLVDSERIDLELAAKLIVKIDGLTPRQEAILVFTSISFWYSVKQSNCAAISVNRYHDSN
jgi:uncharacterized protein (DUF2141 family)